MPKILKIMPLWIFSMKSMGHKVSNELWGGMLASKLSDRQALEIFLRRDTNRDQLTLERAGAQNFKDNATLYISYEKYGP